MSNRFLLEAKNIIKTFPPTVALNDVHFCLRPGEIHGLMGENGSGKSTMCSIVSGIYPYDSGELFLDGEPYCPKNMIDAAAKGVCMIVQEQGTFASTTVAENIFIGKEKQFHNGIRLDTKKMANAAQKILDELQMQHIDARMTCGRLSFEDRKLVEIARAMYSDPKVLIIDETTSALSKNGRDILYGLMEKMKSEGKSVIFISHDIDELMEKCDYLTVFRDGIYIDEVPKEKFNADLIKQLMVGREMVGAYYREDFKPSHEDEVVLSVEHITQGIVTDVSFDAYKGEILGIGGLNECGIAVGVVLGVINGTVYKLLKIPCLIVSLGLLLIYEILAQKIGLGVSKTIPADVGVIGKFPYSLIILGASALLFYYIYNKTCIACHIRAVGNEELLANALGVNAMNTKYMTFVLAGIFIGITAILQISYANSITTVSSLRSISMIFQPLMGVLIAFAIQEWCNLTLGVFISQFTLSMMFNALIALGVPSKMQDVVLGVMLIIVMGIALNNKRISGFFERKARRKELMKRA